MRNVLERASARETTMRVALGALAKHLLEELSIRISSRVVSIGPITDESSPQTQSEYEPVERSDLRVLDHQVEKEMKRWIDHARNEGDTLGGVFEVVVWNLPVGLGSYVQWDRKLDGDLGKAFLSLNAIKGVEVGMGFESSKKSGREAHDEYIPGQGRVEAVSNRSGGISGGVSNGQPLIVRAAMKPLSTLKAPLASVDIRTGQPTTAHFERSDVCAVPSASVIGESLVALVLVDRLMEKFGGDSMGELGARVIAWRKHLGF
jgi:chorismate synthase